METRQLSKYAHALLKSYWNGVLPVDPFVLVRSSGWSVFFSDSLNESDMDFFIDQEEKHIYMQAALLKDVYNSRVICAKALAYAITSSRETMITEDAALGFAAEVLMPEIYLGLVSNSDEAVHRFAVNSNLVEFRRNQMSNPEYASTTGFLPAGMSK